MRKVTVLMGIIMVFAVFALLATPAVAQEAKRMSIQELKGMLGNPDLVIIDVRKDEDWKSSNVKIKGAVGGMSPFPVADSPETTPPVLGSTSLLLWRQAYVRDCAARELP
jgi:hypothetical protein